MVHEPPVSVQACALDMMTRVPPVPTLGKASTAACSAGALALYGIGAVVKPLKVSVKKPWPALHCPL
jgi:hypothetical protein